MGGCGDEAGSTARMGRGWDMTRDTMYLGEPWLEGSAVHRGTSLPTIDPNKPLGEGSPAPPKQRGGRGESAGNGRGEVGQLDLNYPDPLLAA